MKNVQAIKLNADQGRIIKTKWIAACIIRLFTSQPKAAFYDTLFLHLDLSELEQLPISIMSVILSIIGAIKTMF